MRVIVRYAVDRMTTYAATEPKVRASKARDWLFPVRALVLLAVGLPLVLVGAVLSALMREDECSDI